MLITGSRVAPSTAQGSIKEYHNLLTKSMLPFLFCASILMTGCQATGTKASGSTPTISSEAPPMLEEALCPVFDIFDGGSAIRTGEGASLHHQLSIRTTARECTIHANGSHSVDIGVEVLGLLGPKGVPGTYSAPLYIAIKHDDKVLSTRIRQVSVTIPPGSTQNLVRLVEKDIPLPRDHQGLLIEIGLGRPPEHKTPR